MSRTQVGIKRKTWVDKTPLDARTPVQIAAIAVLLNEGPANGYEVVRRINRIMGPSWDLASKSIYSILKPLVKDGLLCLQGEKIYHPTEAARHVWLEWFSTPSMLALIRSDIQVRLAFSREEDIPELFLLLEGYRSDLLRMERANAVGHAHVQAGSYDGLKLRLTRANVEERLKAELKWVEKVYEELGRWVAGRRSG